jgi:hypothetical protein
LAEGALGNLRQSVVSAREGQEAAEQAGQPVLVAYNAALETYEQAQLGNREQAIAAQKRAAELAPTNGYVELLSASAVGHLALADEAPERAVPSLNVVLEIVQGEATAEPEVIRFVDDPAARHGAFALGSPGEQHTDTSPARLVDGGFPERRLPDSCFALQDERRCSLGDAPEKLPEGRELRVPADNHRRHDAPIVCTSQRPVEGAGGRSKGHDSHRCAERRKLASPSRRLLNLERARTPGLRQSSG